MIKKKTKNKVKKGERCFMVTVYTPMQYATKDNIIATSNGSLNGGYLTNASYIQKPIIFKRYHITLNPTQKACFDVFNDIISKNNHKNEYLVSWSEVESLKYG